MHVSYNGMRAKSSHTGNKMQQTIGEPLVVIIILRCLQLRLAWHWKQKNYSDDGDFLINVIDVERYVV